MAESDDVLSREEIERLAFVRLDGTSERPLTRDARRLLAHDAALRELATRRARGDGEVGDGGS